MTDKNKDSVPDLLDNALDGQYVFIGLPPDPLTWNDKTRNNAIGTILGVGVIHVDTGGKVDHYKEQVVVTNMKDGKEAADIHIAVRK
jgi:hypothetical protein